jgi:signal transduction histidine kinase
MSPQIESAQVLEAPADVGATTRRPADMVADHIRRLVAALAGRGIVVRTALLAVVVGGLYALGALLPFWFLTSPEAGSGFFPSAGLTIAVLLMTRTSTWPVWLSVVAIAEIAVDLAHGQRVAMAFGFALANTLEPLTGALGMRWSLGRRRTSRRLFLTFVLWGIVIGPAVGAAIGASVAGIWGTTTSPLTTFANWWIGDSLGVLVIGSCILAWVRRPALDPQMGVGELAGVITATVAVTLVPAILWHHPMIYAILPLLVWAALRGGGRAVTTTGIFLAIAADWTAVTGRANDLIAEGSERQHLAFVQVYLAVALLAALVLALEVAERQVVERRARSAEAERNRAERIAVEAAEGERRRIARETHDIFGHALNVMLLQAGAARRVVAEDVPLATDLLESIEAMGRTAFRDLDVALALTSGVPDRSPSRGLAGVPELTEVMCRAGMRVELTVEGERGDISTLVDWSGYRIVQESLTNVAKHAPGATAHVTIRYDTDAVEISVVDDGGRLPGGADGSDLDGRGGRGLIGIRERVTLLAGQLDVGARAGGGFAVLARLPSEGRS